MRVLVGNPRRLGVMEPLVIEELLVVSSFQGTQLGLDAPAVLCVVVSDGDQLILRWLHYSKVFGDDHKLIVSPLPLLLSPSLYMYD